MANKGYNIDIGKKKTVNLQYTAKGNGYFYFNLKNKDDNYVRINVTANYKTYSSDNTYVYGRNSYRSEKYCFKKGTKVTIKIISEYGSRLSFRLSEKKLKNFEKEKNDTVSKATTMKLKKLTMVWHRRVTKTGGHLLHHSQEIILYQLFVLIVKDLFTLRDLG